MERPQEDSVDTKPVEEAKGQRRMEIVRARLEAAGAELIWRAPTSRSSGLPRRIVEGWHKQGRILVLVEILNANGDLLGWDLYRSVNETNSTADTLNAALDYLTGENAAGGAA